MALFFCSNNFNFSAASSSACNFFAVLRAFFEINTASTIINKEPTRPMINFTFVPESEFSVPPAS